MRKTLRFVKRNIFGFLLGIIFCSFTVVLAESIQSEEVLYDNSNSKTSYDNVQDVLDDMYNIIDHNSLAFSLLTHNPPGLSNELVGGLYRYQGTNVNNYICFGTINKNTCTSDTDKYMYRIIGINTNGQMKLIKKEALNTAYQWHSSVYMVDWKDSTLYNNLNGSYFLTNITYVPDDTWSSKIAEGIWNYPLITNANLSASELSSLEESSSFVINKIGLLGLSDYYYGLVGGNNCSSSGSTCKSSWIHISKNDTGAPNNSLEWTITRHQNGPWAINNSGELWNNYNPSANCNVRPVFFLKASVKIASGSGTITDPYILS